MSEKKVAIRFIRTPDYRVHSADGAWGGISPTGRIEMSFYSERVTLPDVVVHRLSEKGVLLDELREERVQSQEVTRSLVSGVSLSLDSARALHAWLGQQIETLSARSAKEAK